MSRPTIAADPTDTQTRRSLVLAGGGMRVAYQAGVLAALDEAGLRFHHIDGTSGGTMNLSMLLTGQPVNEMCDRWRRLDARSFASPLPLTDYTRSLHWPGLGSGDGVRNTVFPDLGIDAEQIRKADGVVGTYNLCNFVTKTAEVFAHTDVDEDLLVAAISLPVLMPAVVREGVAYTDAVWIRDSNVPEAVRQGSNEVWLVWSIGNTPVYRRGLFRQYVHMIEMAATGSLLGDLGHLAGDPAASGLRLHVIKPSRPIPLDPDYFFGRIDGAGLVGLGYRDACAYLAAPRPLSLPGGPDVTAMAPVEPTLSAGLRLQGSFTWAVPSFRERAGPLIVHLRLEARRAAPDRLVTDAVGDVTIPGWPARQPIRAGGVWFDPAGTIGLSLELAAAGNSYELRGSRDRNGFAVALIEIGSGSEVGSGWLTLGRNKLGHLVASMHASDYPSVIAAWRARSTAALDMWRAGGGTG